MRPQPTRSRLLGKAAELACGHLDPYLVEKAAELFRRKVRLSCQLEGLPAGYLAVFALVFDFFCKVIFFHDHELWDEVWGE